MRPASFLIYSLFLFFTYSGCKTSSPSLKEGFVEVTGGKVWYRIEGQGEQIPVLLLHGGPGSSSFGFRPIKSIARQRPFIFYDQLGSGRSDRITDTTLMTVERYVEEVESVRKALNLDKVFLLGHSWGTALALEYYLKYPDSVEGIIFSSPYFSTDVWIRDADTLIATLPDSIQNIIRTNEKNKTYNNPDYQGAVAYFYSKFLWRKPRSEEAEDSSSMFFASNIYEYMWGPSEFTATGTLLDFDRVANLKDVNVPVLLMTGEFDEARPSTVKYFQSLIPGAAFVEISEAGHATLSDNPEETLRAISQFVNEIDPGPN